MVLVVLVEQGVVQGVRGELLLPIRIRILSRDSAMAVRVLLVVVVCS